jgi:hypothetical protein
MHCTCICIAKHTVCDFEIKRLDAIIKDVLITQASDSKNEIVCRFVNYNLFRFAQCQTGWYSGNRVPFFMAVLSTSAVNSMSRRMQPMLGTTIKE